MQFKQIISFILLLVCGTSCDYFRKPVPSKEILLAQLVGYIKGPISGFVNVLNGNMRNLIGVLNAIKENK